MAWRPAALLNRDCQYRCFLVKFAKFLRTPFFIEHFSDCFCLLWVIKRNATNKVKKDKKLSYEKLKLGESTLIFWSMGKIAKKKKKKKKKKRSVARQHKNNVI